jgi:cell division protein FtsB
MVKSLVKKSLIFQDMFVQLNEKIDSIKLVLFYDAVHKFNYGKELNKVMVELFNTAEDKKLLEMFEFQCIFIKSSYLAGEYFDAKREINKLKYKNDKFESELKAKTNKIDNLENLVLDLKAEIKLLRDEKQLPKSQNQDEGDDNKNIESKKKLPIKKEKYDNNSPITSGSNLSEQKEKTIKKADKKDDSNENNQ